MFLHAALAILPLITNVLAQSAAPYVDPDNNITFYGLTEPVHGVTYGYIFPPTDENSTEFIGEIVAPIATGWVGVSPGGAMVNNLLLLTWLDGETVMGTNRYATDYVQPLPYDGPVITSLASTTINSTHWKWVYRCQNCTVWDGGSFDTSSSGAPAWAFSSAPVDDPTDINTDFEEHTDIGFYGLDFSSAHASASDYDSWTSASDGASASSG